jgi:hypothetical protein
MLDLNHLPKTGNGNIDYFFGDTFITGSVDVGFTTTFSWKTWEKPKGIHTIVIICIGAGGGGRSGWPVNASSRTGGGGGCSGTFTRVIIPAMVLPDVLYVSVGKGGPGGAGSNVQGVVNQGTPGGPSYVSIAPSTASIYVACYANGGSVASDNGSSSSTSASVASVAAVQSDALMSGLGQFFALAGQAGARAQSTSNDSVTYPATGLLLSGGAAGGSAQLSGGSIIMPTQSSFSLIATRNGGSTGGAAGDDGLSISQPLMSIGGAGGASSTSATANGTPGGRGGNGGIGSGGGGGGAGPSGTGSGRGGNGGDGLVIIQTF